MTNVKYSAVLKWILKEFHSDPDCDLFEYSDDGSGVYYTETLESIAKEIIASYDPAKVKRLFGCGFGSWQECFTWLQGHLPELMEYIGENYELIY